MFFIDATTKSVILWVIRKFNGNGCNWFRCCFRFGESIFRTNFNINISNTKMFVFPINDFFRMLFSDKGILIHGVAIYLKVIYFSISLNEIPSVTNVFKLHRLNIFTMKCFPFCHLFRWQIQNGFIRYFTLDLLTVGYSTIKNLIAKSYGACVII